MRCFSQYLAASARLSCGISHASVLHITFNAARIRARLLLIEALATFRSLIFYNISSFGVSSFSNITDCGSERFREPEMMGKGW